MEDFLSTRTKNRIEKIRQHVRDKWAANTGPPWYTFHDDSHNDAVEQMLYSLIPAGKRDQISEKEWFHLLAAAWLHDMGMMLTLEGETESSVEAIRQKHHDRSSRYITRKANRDVLGLRHQEANLIAEICRYHRKRLDINDCERMVGNLRMRLLAAYLRLADALHVDTTRTSEAMYQLLLVAGMPWDSRIHWIKSFWVESIIPDPDAKSIRVELINTKPQSARMALLAQMVGSEIRDELDSIRDVLIRGGVSYYLDVHTHVVDLGLDEDYPFELDLVLSNLEQENLASASEVADSIIDTIIRLTQLGPGAYGKIREYREQLEIVLSKRSCHVLIRSLLDMTARALMEDDIDEAAQAIRVGQIKAELESFKEGRERNLSALAANAQPFLSDGGSILLFGYSSLVLEALRRLPSQKKESTKIYIAEGRGKTQYNHKNELTYCDGIRYAVDTRKAGFPDVVIVPDICAASLMLRKLVDKVVFGANGISPSGDFGHTAGHLAIAESARQHSVPVYVIADTAKFGQFPDRSELTRDNEWLTRDGKSLATLKEYGIETLNPREDRVSRECVDMLITEIGAFPPTKIPKSLQERLS